MEKIRHLGAKFLDLKRCDQKNEELDQLIRSSWSLPVTSSDATSVIGKKLKRLRKILGRWEKNFSNIKSTKFDLLSMIDFLRKAQERSMLDPVERTRLVNSKKEINEIYNKEEIMWRQQSRCSRLKEGDLNTKFFHKVANYRMEEE